MALFHMRLCFRVSCAEVGPRSTTLELRVTRWPRSAARGHGTHVQSTKIKIKVGGESVGARAFPDPTALQNQQLRRNAASRTCRTTLLCKIVSRSWNRTSTRGRVGLWRMEFEPAAHFINLSHLLTCPGPQRWRYATRGAVIV